MPVSGSSRTHPTWPLIHSLTISFCIITAHEAVMIALGAQTLKDRMAPPQSFFSSQILSSMDNVVFGHVSLFYPVFPLSVFKEIIKNRIVIQEALKNKKNYFLFSQKNPRIIIGRLQDAHQSLNRIFMHKRMLIIHAYIPSSLIF
jgi:hypothetical protein